MTQSDRLDEENKTLQCTAYKSSLQSKSRSHTDSGWMEKAAFPTNGNEESRKSNTQKTDYKKVNKRKTTNDII